jgi:cysteinyl-tRNA synthetase
MPGKVLLGLLALAITLSMTLVAAPATAGEYKLLGILVNSWGYQLQNDKVEEIANSPYDVVVIDYSSDSEQSKAFKPEELAKMKVKPDGSRRVVLSYISIGEAESYRYYWTERGWGTKSKRPSYIGAENPEWKGNYTVKFWDEGWQNIILRDDDSYMNRILKAGFDGVYLDKIDIAYDLEGKSPKGTDSIDLMIEFVQTISETMKARNADFLIFPQNAEGLLASEEYRRAVDGIGKEDLLFHEDAVGDDGVYKDGFANKQSEIDESVSLLKKLKDDGRTVLVVEYLHSKDDLQKAAAKFAEWGFVSYFGPRDLARLVPQSQQPQAPVAAAPTTKVASACAGLAEEACTADNSCTWTAGYESTPGHAVAGRCLDKPRSVAPRHKASAAARALGPSKALSSREKGLRMRGSAERGAATTKAGDDGK